MSEEHNERLGFSCELCGESFGSCDDLRGHCGTPKHRFVLLSDEEHPWKHRPLPPLRCTPKKELQICQSHRERGKCHLGDFCCEAHGDDELNEWRERLDFRRAKVNEAHKMIPEGYQEYALDLLCRYSKARDAAAMLRIMTEDLQGLKLICRQPLQCTVSSEETELRWDFELHTITRLQRLVLLRGAHRDRFALRRLRIGAFNYNLPEGCQEWVSNLSSSGNRAVYHIQVAFRASMHGTFRQTLVFDFGGEPVLVRNFTVDAVPPGVVDDIESSRRLILTRRGRWSSTTVDVVPVAESRSASAQNLYNMFPAPDPEVFQLTQSVVGGADFSRENYKALMHELLYVEEMARADIIARYNGATTLQVTANPTEDTFAQGGELFACLPLAAPLTEDTDASRLILHGCSLVWLSLAVDRGGWNESRRRRVFELPIHLIQKHSVCIRLPKGCVQEFGLKPRTSFEAEVQFQLDRLSLCRMHYAVERLPMTSLVLPDFRISPSPCPPEWEHGWDPRLSEQQRRAVAAIVSPSPTVGVAPVLVEGPCGTGKTFVLAQALFELIKRLPDSRVLVCTQSNSAADLFVLDYLEKEVADRPALRPLRLVDEFRMPDHVDQGLLPFCLEVPQEQRSKEGPWFRQPTNQEVEAYRVVVTTLHTSEMLIASGLERGFFTHIFIDEASRAMEAECIVPLALADDNTRIVLAGDCMLLSPEVFSPFARDRRLHESLLERLRGAFSLRPPLRDEDEPPALPHQCRILLTENFRSHEALVRFVSNAFYGGRLRAAALSDSAQPHPHPQIYPLSFFAVRGVDQDQGGTSTSYCNRKEAGEVCEVVKRLAESWPKTWGPCDLATVAVVTPYHDQVRCIRTELRERKLLRVRVESVASVQGKEFRAVILSVVRARATCLALEHAAAKSCSQGAIPTPLNFGFLSDAKALNTALACAQCLVAVVGDPILLCSVGACRSVWEKFITTCALNNSLHCMGWKEIKSALDGLEPQKDWVFQLEEKILLRHPLLTRKPEIRPGLTRDLSPDTPVSARHASGPAQSKSMASHFQSMLLDDDDDDDDQGDSVGREAQGGILSEKSAGFSTQPHPSWPSSQSASRAFSGPAQSKSMASHFQSMLLDDDDDYGDDWGETVGKEVQGGILSEKSTRFTTQPQPSRPSSQSASQPFSGPAQSKSMASHFQSMLLDDGDDWGETVGREAQGGILSEKSTGFATQPQPSRPSSQSASRAFSGPAQSKSMASHFQSMLLDDDDDGGDWGETVGKGAQGGILSEKSTGFATQLQPSRPSSQSASRAFSSQPEKQFHGNSRRAASVGRSSDALKNGMPRSMQIVKAASSQPSGQPSCRPSSQPSSRRSPCNEPQKQFHGNSGRVASAGKSSNASGNRMSRTMQTGLVAGSQPCSQLSSCRFSYSQPESKVVKGAVLSQTFHSQVNKTGGQSWRKRSGGGGRPDHMAACKEVPRPPDERPNVAYVSAGDKGVTWEKRRLSRDGRL